MREIGIRELKATLSEILRAVQAGESVRVTNRGRPVAEILPPRKLTLDERLEEMAAQGLITPAKLRGPLPPGPPPKQLPSSVAGGSALILAERDSYYRDSGA